MEYPKPLPKEIFDELLYIETIRSAHISAVLRVLNEVSAAAGLTLDVDQLFLEARIDLLREALTMAKDDSELASRLYADIQGHGG